MLSSLKRRGYLGAAVVYPLIGYDYFPAGFTKIFGFNFRQALAVDSFAAQFGSCGGTVNAKMIAQNLKFFQIEDSRNVGTIKGELEGSGFFDIRGKRSLLLKGTFADMFLKVYDRDLERYLDENHETAAREALLWIRDIVGEILQPGDHIIAFDEDIQIVPEDIALKVWTAKKKEWRPKKILPLSHPGKMTIMHYLPAVFAVFRVR